MYVTNRRENRHVGRIEKGSGDPLNLVIIGKPLELYYAFLRADWDETETKTAGSTMKTIAAFFRGNEYRYSPISSLYVFGRSQDVAFQKIRQNINERNHLRLWMAPVRFHGEQVWISSDSVDLQEIEFKPWVLPQN